MGLVTKDMNKLNTHIKNKEFDEARHLAHALKGAAGTLGLMQMQEAARVLEIKLKNNDAKNTRKKFTHSIEIVNARQKYLHE